MKRYLFLIVIISLTLLALPLWATEKGSKEGPARVERATKSATKQVKIEPGELRSKATKKDIDHLGEESITSTQRGELAHTVKSDTTLRPIGGKLGLVLAGGGAKGFYHIGVIKALEENNIPIDYISGTSMGAIVAALYASGYSPDEMIEIATSGEVEKWVSGKIDEKYKFYFYENSLSPNMLSIYAEVKRDTLDQKREVNLALPHSFINTAQIDLALLEFFSPASAACGGDFDKLMIPFRCIATDMNDHSAVELSEGDLPFAVRASMSYPMLFRPVTDKKERVLIDGGCYDNFPWRVLEQDFNPDFFVGAQCLPADEPADAQSSIEEQVMAMVTLPTDYELPEGKSLLIQRDVEAGLLDFAASKQTIADGYADAMALMPQLKEAFSSRRERSEVEAKRKAFRESCPPLVMGGGELKGLRPRQKQYARTLLNFTLEDSISHFFETQYEGFDELKDRYFTLMASNDFTTNSFPKMVYDSVEYNYKISFDISTKPQMRYSVGGNLSSTAYNQIHLGINYFTVGRTAQSGFLNIFLGPMSTIARLGGRTVVLKRKPLYLDYDINFSRLSTLQGSLGNVTPAHNALKARTIESYAHFGLGFSLTRKSIFEISSNAGYNFYDYEGFYDEPGATHTHDRFRYIAGQLLLERSTLDKMMYATSGTKISLSVIGVHGKDSYDVLGAPKQVLRHFANRSWVGAKAKWEHYPGDWQHTWFSLGYNIEGVYTNHPKFGNEMSTTLSTPRYTPTPHSNMIFMPDFYADRYLATGLMPTFSMMKNFYLRAGLYAMLRDPIYPNNENTTFDVGDYLQYIADLSFVYHTRIGPISLAVTKYDIDSWDNCYVTFNFGYPIFGKKGLYY